MLTDARIKAAKPGEKDYKIGDTGQLYLFVSTAGGEIWRMNYTFGKNAKGYPAQRALIPGAKEFSLVKAGARAMRRSAAAAPRRLRLAKTSARSTRPNGKKERVRSGVLVERQPLKGSPARRPML